MPTDLLSQHCQSLPKNTPPLDREAANEFRSQLSDHWTVIDGHHIEGRFEFGDFLVPSYSRTEREGLLNPRGITPKSPSLGVVQP